jgi:hypothetical protein
VTGDAPQWHRDLVAFHACRLAILLAKPVDDVIPCPVCAGTDARGKELCGCQSQCTVADAIKFHERELCVLGAR